jgi:tRNA threonylcarbamoyl adenosine modification protein YjeE
MKEVFYDLYGYNAEIFYFFNHLGNIGILPETLRCLSAVFNIENFAIYYVVLCAVCFYRLFSSRAGLRGSQDAEVKLPRPSDLRFAASEGNKLLGTYNTLVFIGICYAVFGLIYAALKFSINLPRPYCSLPAGSFQTILDLSHERCMSSFPSSHSGLALMLTILSWRYLSLSCRIFVVLVVLSVALSRISLAMHYPADILYSYIIVLVVLCVAKGVFKVFKPIIVSLGQAIASSRGSRETSETFGSSPKETIYKLHNTENSKELAHALASILQKGDVVTFHGDLGAGKTFIAREIIRFFCGAETHVPSPTFNILQVHKATDFSIYHYDLYRLKAKEELYELGFEEALDGNVCLVEWPEIADGMLCGNIEVHLEIDGEMRICRVLHA